MDDDFDNYDFDDDFPSPEVKGIKNKNGDVLDEIEQMGGFSLDGGTNPALKTTTTPVPNPLAWLKSGLNLNDKEDFDFAEIEQ